MFAVEMEHDCRSDQFILGVETQMRVFFVACSCGVSGGRNGRESAIFSASINDLSRSHTFFGHPSRRSQTVARLQTREGSTLPPPSLSDKIFLCVSRYSRFGKPALRLSEILCAYVGVWVSDWRKPWEGDVRSIQSSLSRFCRGTPATSHSHQK